MCIKYEDLNSKFLEQIDFELNNLKPKIEKEAPFVAEIEF